MKAHATPSANSQMSGQTGVLARFGIYIALGVAVIQTVYPLLWVLFGSLKDNQQLFANPWGLPTSLYFENYVQAWKIAGLGTRLMNSIIVTVAALTTIVLVSTPCAYAVARLKFPGRNALLLLIVAAMLVPPQITAIPLFITARDMGLINSRIGVAIIMAATSIPLSVFILRSFFLGLPAELEDAARMDGAGRFAILFRVMLPLARPGIALVVIYQFIDVWNEFFLAFLLLRRPEVQTIPMGLVAFFQEFDSLWTLYFAALVITTLPVIIVFLLMQRHFISGLTAGAVKG